MLTLGSVPYANARPLLDGLAEDPAVRLILEPPAVLADRLDAGELDAALVPSVAVLRRPRPVVPVACIGSVGEVHSVALFGRRPLGPGARVGIDVSSRTSAALTRVLLAGPLGVPDAVFESVPPTVDPQAHHADAVLLIGDPALAIEREGLVVTDLGAAWTDWTGLPFVWAVWAARDAAAAVRVADRLERARDAGLARLDEHAAAEARRLGLPEPLMRRYLGGWIRFVLGAEQERALARFEAEARHLGLLDAERRAG